MGPSGGRAQLVGMAVDGDVVDDPAVLPGRGDVAAVDWRDRRLRETVRRRCEVLTPWRTMGTFELVTAADVQLMQGLAQRVTAIRPELVNSDASFGELAWIFCIVQASDRPSCPLLPYSTRSAL